MGFGVGELPAGLRPWNTRTPRVLQIRSSGLGTWDRWRAGGPAELIRFVQFSFSRLINRRLLKLKH